MENEYKRQSAENNPHAKLLLGLHGGIGFFNTKMLVLLEGVDLLLSVKYEEPDSYPICNGVNS